MSVSQDHDLAGSPGGRSVGLRKHGRQAARSGTQPTTVTLTFGVVLALRV